MSVKLVARSLDLIGLFAEHRRPLVLTDIAQYMDIPMSSCLAMIRTFIEKGYLYKVEGKSAYYPTRKLLVQANLISKTDPMAEIVHEHLERLVTVVDETVVLGTLLGQNIMYLDVVSSTQPIRYFTEIGTLRAVHANSIGLSILANWSKESVVELLQHQTLSALTEKTLTNIPDLLAYLDTVRDKGYATNLGFSIPDLAAVAMAFQANGEWYGVSIVGPQSRMSHHWDSLIVPLQTCIQSVISEIDLTSTL